MDEVRSHHPELGGFFYENCVEGHLIFEHVEERFASISSWGIGHGGKLEVGYLKFFAILRNITGMWRGLRQADEDTPMLAHKQKHLLKRK